MNSRAKRSNLGAIRTTATNCRVSFIDLYLVFPRNFRMVFLPHTNTVILLEAYCGTITELGLPVVSLDFYFVLDILFLSVPEFKFYSNHYFWLVV